MAGGVARVTAPTAAQERAAAAVVRLLSEASPPEVDAVAAAARPVAEELDDTLWGAQPPGLEVLAGAVANLRRQFAVRHRLEEQSLSRADAAELLRVSQQAVTDALESHRLLGFKRGRSWCIPAWQFSADTQNGVLPGLTELADVFPGGVIALSSWVVSAPPDLNGLSPRDLLEKGEVEAVVGLAGTLTAAGW